MSDIEFFDDSTSDSETEEDTNDSVSEDKYLISLPILVPELKGQIINEHFIKKWHKTGFFKYNISNFNHKRNKYEINYVA